MRHQVTGYGFLALPPGPQRADKQCRRFALASHSAAPDRFDQRRSGIARTTHRDGGQDARVGKQCRTARKMLRIDGTSKIERRQDNVGKGDLVSSVDGFAQETIDLVIVGQLALERFQVGLAKPVLLGSVEKVVAGRAGHGA